MRKTAIAILLLGLAFSLPAGFHKSEPAGLQIWFPDDWTVSDDEGALTAESPDGQVFCTLEALEEEKDLQSALEGYADYVGDYFDGFAAEGEPQKGFINNLESAIVQGKARRDESPWDVDVAIVSSGKAIAIFIGGNANAVSRQYETAFQRILANLKKI